MAKDMILVTGATGKTGSKTVENLRKAEASVRALVHRENGASEHLKSIGADVVVGDFHDFHSIRPAFEGIAASYFCYPIKPDAVEVAAIFAQAAVEAEVEAIVNISQICARREAKSHAAFHHWISERLFDRTGIPVTHLRPTFFSEWFLFPGHLAMINEGHVRFPFHRGKHAPITAEDQARLIAEILLRPAPHAGKTYNLAGPEEHTYQEWFAKLSEIVGRKIDYQTTTDEETHRIFSNWYGDFTGQHITEVAKDYDNGVFEGTDQIIEKVTGRKPMGFEEFIRKNISAFRIG